MIKANELRFGIWVYKHGKPYRIDDKIEPDDELDYDPIPLSVEILEKAGFEKERFGHVTHEEDGQYWRNGDITIVQFTDGVSLYGSEWTHSIRLPYVHQIQNLYFSLTGKELEINL